MAQTQGALEAGMGAVPAVVSWPRRRRISTMALYRSPLVSQNWGEQPAYSQAPTAPVDEGALTRCPTQASVGPRPSAKAHTQQHHEVSEFQGSTSSCPGPLHLGHPGTLALQCGELLVTGGRSANTHTTRLSPQPRAAGADHTSVHRGRHRDSGMEATGAWWGHKHD